MKSYIISKLLLEQQIWAFVLVQAILEAYASGGMTEARQMQRQIMAGQGNCCSKDMLRLRSSADAQQIGTLKTTGTKQTTGTYKKGSIALDHQFCYASIKSWPQGMWGTAANQDAEEEAVVVAFLRDLKVLYLSTS